MRWRGMLAGAGLMCVLVACPDQGEIDPTPTDVPESPTLSPTPAPADADRDGHASPADCDDTNPEVYPGAVEQCNDQDDDCDEETDEDAVDAGEWYQDNDDDGYGATEGVLVECEAPPGWVGDDGDCNDEDSSQFPGAAESCDGVDANCDGVIDLEYDLDENGVPDCLAEERCDGQDNNLDGNIDEGFDLDEDGYTSCGGDCDDLREEVFPGADETCDGVDSNCDGSVDTEFDVDDDGVPDCLGLERCDGLDNDADGAVDEGFDQDEDGWTVCAGDCDDSLSSSHPDALEYCNSRDDNCDGEIDEDTAEDAQVWYADNDQDGFGDAAVMTTACAAPAGYVSRGTDCDDESAAIRPSATEVCDGLDNDCDGEVDESSAAGASSWYLDEDGDGFGDPGAVQVACEVPDGYVADKTDCDDGRAAVNPAEVERCNELDDNCNGAIDEPTAVDAPTFYQDLDQDGFGDLNQPTVSCVQPMGWVSDATDCADTVYAVNPAATEVCDTVDNNCDGAVDESSAADAATWYADSDGDGYGNLAQPQVACQKPDGYVSDDADCDDTQAAISPSGLEVCDGADNDCNGQVDEPEAADALVWYYDGDTDGYGDLAQSTFACSSPASYVSQAGDCDDLSAAVNPLATERCNQVDDNCDGTVDESTATDAATWYADYDGDGFGEAATSAVSCTAPPEYVANSLDCDDDYAEIKPGADERCDGVDNNCDGLIDDSSAVDAQVWYADLDHDSYGNPGTTQVACSQPVGYVLDSSDCDDSSALASPQGVEQCDSLDNNCDGKVDDGTATDAKNWYTDADLDGYGAGTATAVPACSQPAGMVGNNTDCNDSAIAINPAASEVCDGADNNCNGKTDEGTANTGLEGYWSFNSCDGKDESGKGRNGTLGSPAPVCTTGKVAKAFQFAGSMPEHVSIAGFPNLSTALSISAWIKPRNYAHSINPIITKGYGAEPYTLWASYTQIQLLLNWNSGYEIWCAGNVSLQNEQWYHVAATYDSSAAKVFLYLNSAKVGECSYNRTLYSNTENLYISSSYPGGQEYYRGDIDEVRVHSRAITACEVGALYREGTGG